MRRKYIKNELIQMAKKQDVFDILLRDGVPMTCKNNIYRHKVHDSMVITPNKGFYWHSRDIGSSNPIDYYIQVENMNFLEAVEKVLEVMNCDIESEMNITDEHIYQNTQKKVRGEFVQPRRAYTNKNVYAYLTITRGIEPAIVNKYIDECSIYQDSKYGNVVFVGKDYEGNIVSAFRRSTYTNGASSWTRGDEEGSQKEYRFRVENKSSKVLNIFESEIDLLSYLSMKPMEERNENYIALGGLSDKALIKFLENREVEELNICTDNDEKGHLFYEKITEKLGDKYIISRQNPIKKDFNEDLLAGFLLMEKKNLFKHDKFNVIQEDDIDF